MRERRLLTQQVSRALVHLQELSYNPTSRTIVVAFDAQLVVYLLQNREGQPQAALLTNAISLGVDVLTLSQPHNHAHILLAGCALGKLLYVNTQDGKVVTVNTQFRGDIRDILLLETAVVLDAEKEFFHKQLLLVIRGDLQLGLFDGYGRLIVNADTYEQIAIAQPVGRQIARGQVLKVESAGKKKLVTFLLHEDANPLAGKHENVAKLYRLQAELPDPM